MKKKSISERAIIGFDHGLPCRVKNMTLGPQLRQKPRPSASVFVYWVPRAMFFTRHGRPWSNPTACHFGPCYSISRLYVEYCSTRKWLPTHSHWGEWFYNRRISLKIHHNAPAGNLCRKNGQKQIQSINSIQINICSADMFSIMQISSKYIGNRFLSFPSCRYQVNI